MAKKRKVKKSLKQISQKRLLFVLFLLSFVLVFIIRKLIYLQIFDVADQYEAQVDQSVDEVEVSASRGNILDRNGNILVQDSSAKSVHIIPLDVETGKEKDLATILAQKLGLDYKEVYEKVTRLENDRVEMKSGVSQDVADTITKKITKGIAYKNGTIYCIPDEIADSAAAASAISDATGMEYDSALKYLTQRENSPIKIKGKVDNSLAQEIIDSQSKKDAAGKTGSTNGIELIEDSRRYYTNGNFASYLLGFIDANYDGLSGVEATCNDILSGEKGIAYFQKDATGNTIPSQTKIIKQPTQGKNITLSIDSNIQNMAEKAVSSTIEEWKAKSGTAIVMDTKTGKILAMASKPDYDLNDPYTISDAFKAKKAEDLSGKSESDQLSEMWKNPAVASNYEPGSTFKAVTAAAALEEGVVSPDTTVYCSGSININGVTVNCTGNHGTQSVTEAIANSCNPGMVQIIQRLDPNKFYQYAYNFGYGEKTGIELTGEEAGLISRRFDDSGAINELDYSTLSFGQGLATTPIQNLAALNCVVNNGYYMEPSVLADNNDSALGLNGKLGYSKQIVSSETSKEMRDIMVNVVTGSSTLKNLSEGYSIGGKTGTAEKFVDGAYSKTAYVTSFFCYAPVEDPQYSILMVLDEPSSDASGGTSAAPAAIEIMKQILGASGSSVSSTGVGGTVVVPDLVGLNLETAKAILDEKGIAYTVNQKDHGSIILSQSIDAKGSYAEGETLALDVGTLDSIENGKVLVPDLTGLSVQFCNELLKGLGLNLKVHGSGFATGQNPAPGSAVDKNSDVTVTFAQ
ncbi:MAG: penicillin-binding transpeptidase domain-containing protein [Eubacterium aggregans]